MRRWLYLSAVLIVSIGSLLLAPVYSAAALQSSQSTHQHGTKSAPPDEKSRPSPSVQSTLKVSVTPWGPDQATIDATKSRLLKDPSVTNYLSGTKHRLLSFELLESQEKLRGRPAPPRAYRALIFDYTNNRCVNVKGRFDSTDLDVSISQDQPIPSDEEFDAAIEILLRDPQLGPPLRDKRLLAYLSMPPVVEFSQADDRAERTLRIQLMPVDAGLSQEIVRVNMMRETVLRLSDRPTRTAPDPSAPCGVPSGGQPTTSRGTAGQFEVVITQGNTEIWRFVAVRPAASSGTRGSGIELIGVDYRGKRVLGRAHAPILNVQYQNNGCGPFRDWQWQEGMFVANGTDVAPGIRNCTSPPETILDNGTDTGNFRGVALFISGPEVMLVSEMQAGWYRYISEWRFHEDGTIRPRFGFGGVSNNCVCIVHFHHIYWRFDFDINTPENNIVYENALRGWRFAINTEVKRIRDDSFERKWFIQNIDTRNTYSVIAPRSDGFADAYARGDVWVLRNRSTEFDDGHNSTTTNTEADLDQFVNGESVQNQDVVLWYAAHFTHDEIGGGAAIHIVGPDLVPVAW
ncbi:MAG: hypothetical protein L0229_30010 [Blastocatellia bacterium]|nr:hypothetical protein [Blastocatellia bacterium]